MYKSIKNYVRNRQDQRDTDITGLKKCDKNFNFKKRNTQEKNIFLCEEISIKYHVLLALNHTHKRFVEHR